jgi:hypothetical protein
MARIFLFPKGDPLAMPGGAGLVVDSPVWGAIPEKARFVELPDVATAILMQDVSLDVQYPGGSIGAFVTAGIQAGLQDWYHISVFAHDGPEITEYGTIVADVVLTWEIDFPESYVTSFYLSSSLGSIIVSGDQFSITLIGINLGASETWTLQANLTDGAIYAQTTYLFGHKLYYGRGDAPDLTESTLEALDTAVLTDKLLTEYTFSENSAGATKAYLWVCYPEEFGVVPRFRDVATFLPVEFMDAGSINVTNTLGILRLYRMARSVNTINGAITVEAY